MRSRAPIVLGLLASLLASALGSGCSLFRYQRDEAELGRLTTWITGALRVESPTGQPLVVLVFRESASGTLEVYEREILFENRSYYFIVEPGSYALGAFEDANEDLVFQVGERWASYRSGERIVTDERQNAQSGLDLVVPAQPSTKSDRLFDVSGPRGTEVVAVPPLDVGTVVTLDDPRLSRRVGRLGFESPLRYFKETRPGVYFLEEYDPRKIPVLMVHGISGSPVEFEALIRGAPESADGEGFAGLDPARYQPWLVSYPSSFPLTVSADSLHAWMSHLHARFRPERVFLVAHSMGGLVSRALINAHQERTPYDDIKVFVSIATPWGGVDAAELGLHYSPVVIPSWRDIAPGSGFLERLVERPLPETIRSYLIFPYGGLDPLSMKSGDGTIAMESLLEPSVQDEATGVYGVDASHAGILSHPRLVAKVRQILDQASR